MVTFTIIDRLDHDPTLDRDYSSTYTVRVVVSDVLMGLPKLLPQDHAIALVRVEKNETDMIERAHFYGRRAYGVVQGTGAGMTVAQLTQLPRNQPVRVVLCARSGDALPELGDECPSGDRADVMTVRVDLRAWQVGQVNRDVCLVRCPGRRDGVWTHDPLNPEARRLRVTGRKLEGRRGSRSRWISGTLMTRKVVAPPTHRLAGMHVDPVTLDGPSQPPRNVGKKVRFVRSRCRVLLGETFKVRSGRRVLVTRVDELGFSGRILDDAPAATLRRQPTPFKR